MGLLLGDILTIPSNKDKTIFKIVSSDPTRGIDGEMIINSTTDEIKVWYNSVWNTIDITINPGVAITPVTGNPFGAWLGIWRTYTI